MGLTLDILIAMPGLVLRLPGEEGRGRAREELLLVSRAGEAGAGDAVRGSPLGDMDDADEKEALEYEEDADEIPSPTIPALVAGSPGMDRGCVREMALRESEGDEGRYVGPWDRMLLSGGVA